MRTLRFMIGCFILIGSVLISGSIAEEALDPFLVKVEKDLESALEKIQNVQKEMGAAVQEVHLAQQELENSGGFFPPILAQERLRNARKKHHELSQDLKDSRRDMGLLMKTIWQRLMKETSGFDQQILELDQQIETANPKQAEKLKKQRSELDRERQTIRQKFEDRLGRLGASIRQVMRWQEPVLPVRRKVLDHWILKAPDSETCIPFLILKPEALFLSTCRLRRCLNWMKPLQRISQETQKDDVLEDGLFFNSTRKKMKNWKNESRNWRPKSIASKNAFNNLRLKQD